MTNWNGGERLGDCHSDIFSILQALKIVVLGDHAVGKSGINIWTFELNQFDCLEGVS